jgi:hypothetical protein
MMANGLALGALRESLLREGGAERDKQKGVDLPEQITRARHAEPAAPERDPDKPLRQPVF